MCNKQEELVTYEILIYEERHGRVLQPDPGPGPCPREPASCIAQWLCITENRMALAVNPRVKLSSEGQSVSRSLRRHGCPWTLKSAVCF